MAGAPFGAFLMGTLTDLIGPSLVAVVPAAGMTLLIAWMILGTPIWNIKVERVKG